jgi:nucleoside-diphosphate-sugar epimerase
VNPPPDGSLPPEVQFLAGDVTSADDARALCTGCDSVIHAAAHVREGGDPRPFERINVGGTRTMAAAAEAAGVKRFVQISSVMVYGFDALGKIDETAPLDGAGNPYCQTKIDSEREALARQSAGGMQVNVVRCGEVYGPGSFHWTIRPVRTMLFKSFRLIDGGVGLMNHVYIDNLVDGILLALDSDRGGEAYNICDGVATTCRDFYGHYARMIGPQPLPTMSAGWARFLLRAQRAIMRLVGRQSKLHHALVSYMTRHSVYSIQKARDQLGYEPRVGLDEGMRLSEAWLRTSGILPSQPEA